MAKNPTSKPAIKPELASVDASPAQAEASLTAATEKPAAAETSVAIAKPTEPVTASSPKKDVSISSKPKKPVVNTAKPGSMLPSAQKLEHLKAAVNAAGGTENLLAILHHVDEAGGRAEVADSIEAYRVLKTVLE